MFKNNFVVAIKVDGKILKETKDLVYLPFGTEYSILLKNLEARKASVDISIDGEDVLNNGSLVIHPEQTAELRGFVKNSHVTNRFRFIEKTDKISNHRGDKIDDGMVRVEITYEETVPRYWVTNTDFYQVSDCIGAQHDFSDQHTFTNVCDSSLVNVSQNQQNQALYSANDSQNQHCEPMNEDGITVRGTVMNQQLRHEFIGSLEPESTVIVLRLKGTGSDSNKVTRPLTVKTTCPTCGHSCRNANFCPGCGTCLICDG